MNSRRLVLWIPLVSGTLLALASVPELAWSGTIRGHLHLSAGGAGAAQPTLNPYPGRANSLPGSRQHERGAVSNAVIYLEGLPDGAGPLPEAGAPLPKLMQKGQAFVPRVLPVARG